MGEVNLAVLAFSPMKTINRMALGTISSLLLAAGFTRTAQKLDPISNAIDGMSYNMADAPSIGCFPCLLITEQD
jgi:hypothetical protein